MTDLQQSISRWSRRKREAHFREILIVLLLSAFIIGTFVPTSLFFAWFFLGKEFLFPFFVISLALYGASSVLLAVILYQFRRKQKYLEESNLVLEKQAEEIKHLLEISEERRVSIEIKNEELEKNKIAIFKLMHEVEEVNKCLRSQSEELEKSHKDLENLNKKLVFKQEEFLKTMEALEEANMELQRLDQMKSEFISNVSHEIRTPLTSIREGVSLILENALGPVNPQQEKFLNIVQNNVIRLSALIHDILDLSKLESGRMEFIKGPMDIQKLIAAVLESLKMLAYKRNIAVETSFSQDLPLVYADRERIEQVLINLVGNALKFTQDGGMIVIGAYRLPGTEMIHVSVMDTGRGIPKEEISEVFNKFYQINREEGSGAKGTGLGLPICQQIIGLHGGEIWAESEMGRGSKFTFTLPVFSAEKYLEDLFHDRLARAQTNGKQVAFVLYHIENFAQLKESAGRKQTEQLFSHFQELVFSRTDNDWKSVSNPEHGLILVIEMASEEAIAKTVSKVKESLSTASFFLGDQEVTPRFCVKSSAYPRDGMTCEKLLEFLSLNKQMLIQCSGQVV